MCHYREEGGGPRDAMYARLRRNIRRRQIAAENAALEATVRRWQRRVEELRARVAASDQRIAELRAQAAALELVLVWTESKRLRAGIHRFKLYICFLFLLNQLAIFLLGAIVKKMFKY